MTQELQVLIAGESWETTSIHQKGFDIFTTTFYEEGVGPLKARSNRAATTSPTCPATLPPPSSPQN